MDFYGQQAYDVRCDWGVTGALAAGADVAVVVDVLSFSTTVTVAVERGMTVLPFPWKDERAAAFAQAQGAELAVGRLEAQQWNTGNYSLSAAALKTATPCRRFGSSLPQRVNHCSRIGGDRR